MYKQITQILFLIMLITGLSGCIETSEVKISIPGKINDDVSAAINLAPVMDSISSQTVPSLTSITTIDAGENGLDVDSNGNQLAYSCFYDTTVDAVVTSITSCTALTGVTFSPTTGVMDWTPGAGQIGIYEFKIIATDGALSDEVLFSISVNDNNQAPVLDTIADQSVNEAVAITTINAGVSGADVDVDGDTLNYSCFFDTTINGAVASTSACSTLSGVSFSTSTGVMNWTPDYTQSGNYEYIITATDGALSDSEIFSITVADVNRAPVLDAIADQTVSEGIAITTINAGDSGADTDIDGQTITYSCYVDTSINGVVASTTACSTISGVNFTAATGVMDWMPDMTQSGAYEFKIVGSDGSLSDDEIFSITVANVNQAPLLDNIDNETINEGVAMTTIDASDGGDDFDVDGEALTYQCKYDTTFDWDVFSGADCSTLTGMSFSTSTGVMNWTPSYSQSGTYEFMITARDAALLHNSSIFHITVNDVNRAPVLAAIGNQSVAEGAAITTINANDGGDDLDADGTAITYTCFYDSVVDAAVASTNACTTLSGVSFTGSTGVMTWTPGYTQSGSYEFKIIGSDGSLSDSKIFSIAVSNVPRPPSLDAISNQTVVAGTAITAVDAADGGDDFDVDGEALTYACYYDTTVNSAVAITNTCATLPGGSFSSSTGILNWTPSTSQVGQYEFKIVAQDGSSSVSRIFVITVNSSPNFITVWRTATTNVAVTLPMKNGGTFNFTVDWGDGSPVGTVTSYADTDKTHTYATAGDYTVTITGVMSSIGFEGSASRLNLIRVNNMGSVGVTNLADAFKDCTNLTHFTGGDTSQVTTMAGMFYGATKLAVTDFTNFNTASVTTMTNMFRNTYLMATVNLSTFNTAAVTDMSNMFYNCLALTSLDLSSFNTANVTNMSYMFYNSPLVASYNLSSFDTTKVTTMAFMFYQNSQLTSLNISNFNTANVVDMMGMFLKTIKLDALDLSNFNTVKVLNMQQMFQETSAVTINVSSFNTLAVTDMSNMFNGANKVVSLNLASFVTTNVLTMQGMFYNTPLLETIDLQNFNTAKVVNFQSMFGFSPKITTLNLSHFNTAAATTMAGMFESAIALNSLDVSSFNTANVIYMGGMFSGTKLTSLNLSHFNTSKVTTMNNMFQNMVNLTTLNVTSFDTSKVVNMAAMFSNTSSLASVDISSFRTPLVVDLSFMFQGTKLASIDLSNFNTTANKNLRRMFYMAQTTSLITNPAIFSTAAVVDMSEMFYYATGFVNLDLSYFNTNAVTNMNSMFQGTNLTTLNTTGWNITLASASVNVFTAAKATMIVYCTPVASSFFTKTCQ